MMIASCVFFVAVGHLVAEEQAGISVKADPSLVAVAKAFQRLQQERLSEGTIDVASSLNSTAVRSLTEKKAQAALVSRAVSDTEIKASEEKQSELIPHVVAYEALIIVVHPNNPIDNVRIEDLSDIYHGKISNWKSLGGSDREIAVFSREQSRTIFHLFTSLVMDDQSWSVPSHVRIVPGGGALERSVKQDESAIGYTTLGFVDETLKALNIRGTVPTYDTIGSAKYSLARPVYLYTNGRPHAGGSLEHFIRLFKSEEGRKTVKDLGLIPVAKEDRKDEEAEKKGSRTTDQ